MATIGDVLANYLAHAIDIAPSTQRTCRYIVNAWKARSSDPPAEQITAETFDTFRHRCLADGLSPHTIEGWCGYVSLMLREFGLHPGEGRRLKRPEPDPTMPTLEHFGRVYAAAEFARFPQGQYVPAPVYMRTLLVFGLWTGLRLSDWFTIERSDIDNAAIRRRAKKTGKHHEYPNCEVLRRHLALLPRRDGPLFPAGATCPTHLRDWIGELCDAADVPRFTPQEVRRLSVNLWCDANPCAGAIIQGTAIGRRSAMPWYLARSKPRRILELAAPAFRWPDEVLTNEEREQRTSGIEELLTLVKRLPTSRLPDLQRIALAFAE